MSIELIWKKHIVVAVRCDIYTVVHSSVTITSSATADGANYVCVSPSGPLIIVVMTLFVYVIGLFLVCSGDMFRCDDGRCLQNHIRCDGLNQCTDASDEKNCSKMQQFSSMLGLRTTALTRHKNRMHFFF